MTRRFLMASALIAAVSSPSVAQTRDVQRVAPGTASITGVVMLDQPTPRPIRRALVQLTETSGATAPIAAITEDNGTFVFRDLRPGTYTLVASRSAYVSSGYGAKTYGRGSGIPITVAAGQQVKDIAIKMIRGGVIAGTLRDQAGRPAAGAELILMAMRTDGGRRRIVPILNSARTDTRGEYRIYGLAPGDYIVRANPSVRGSQPEGSNSGRPVTYAPAYYPGTSDAATASVVTLPPGGERLGIDFSFSLVATATVSGRLSGPDGLAPRNASVTMQPLTTGPVAFLDAMIGLAQTGGFGGGMRVNADGTFSGSGISPGRYRMVFRGAPASAPVNRMGAELGAFTAMVPGMAGMTGATLWAYEEISVDGRDITGIDVRLQPGLNVSGTVVFEGEDPKSPQDPSGVSVNLTNADREATSALDMVFGMMNGGGGGQAKKDGTFVVNGVSPGKYRLLASPPGVMNPFGGTAMVSPNGWVLKSAMWQDRDLADSKLDVAAGADVSGVVLTFSKAVTEISGRILDASGKPAPGFPIVVFSTKPADWVSGSRRVISAKPSSDGSYRVRGLPTGEYYVCALADLDSNDLFDPAFLEQLSSSSFRLTLAEGEKKTQDLKLGGGS